MGWKGLSCHDTEREGNEGVDGGRGKEVLPVRVWANNSFSLCDGRDGIKHHVVPRPFPVALTMAPVKK